MATTRETKETERVPLRLDILLPDVQELEAVIAEADDPAESDEQTGMDLDAWEAWVEEYEKGRMADDSEDEDDGENGVAERDEEPPEYCEFDTDVPKKIGLDTFVKIFNELEAHEAEQADPFPDNDNIGKLISQNRLGLLSPIIGAFLKSSKQPWNTTVHGLTFNVLKLLKKKALEQTIRSSDAAITGAQEDLSVCFGIAGNLAAGSLTDTVQRRIRRTSKVLR